MKYNKNQKYAHINECILDTLKFPVKPMQQTVSYQHWEDCENFPIGRKLS